MKAVHWLTQAIAGRLLLASLVLLPLLVGATGLVLERAFRQSLMQAEREQLLALVYLLLAEADVEPDQVSLPKVFTEPRFSQPGSGLYGFVHAERHNRLISAERHWQSGSAQWLQPADLGLSDDLALQPELINFGERPGYFFLHYRVRWELAGEPGANGNSGNNASNASNTNNADNKKTRELPLVFSLYHSDQVFGQQLSVFRDNLWRWLTGVALGLLALQALLMRWGLAPLRELSNAVGKLERGEVQSLGGQFARELQPLVKNINSLLNSELQQRERYRNTLADLAHSIKTPLAVSRSELSSATPDARLLQEQVARMEDIVGRQLQRAATAHGALRTRTDAAPVARRLCNSLHKLYPAVQFSVQDFSASLAVDEKDLFELLGNLIENACKYGASHVQVSGEARHHRGQPVQALRVQDNGPGLAPAARDQILRRGQRLDEQQPGQGLGLGLVQDIVTAYQGELQLQDSPGGGLTVICLFPERRND